MQHKDTAKRLIDQLEHFRVRPGLYIRPFDVSHVEAFLQGFDVALAECGINLDHRAVWAAHGIEESPLTVGHRMQAQGHPPEVVVNKLIDLVVTALNRAADGAA